MQAGVEAAARVAEDSEVIDTSNQKGLVLISRLVFTNVFPSFGRITLYADLRALREQCPKLIQLANTRSE